MQRICLGGESAPAAAEKAKTRSPEQKLYRQSDLARGAGAAQKGERKAKET